MGERQYFSKQCLFQLRLILFVSPAPEGRTTARLSAATRRRPPSCGAVALDLTVNRSRAYQPRGPAAPIQGQLLQIDCVNSALCGYETSLRPRTARVRLPMATSASEPRPQRDYRSPPTVRKAWHLHRRCMLTHLS